MSNLTLEKNWAEEARKWLAYQKENGRGLLNIDAVEEVIDSLLAHIDTLQKDNDNLKAEVEKVNRKNTDIWAILNGLGLKMYSEDETIQMVWERAEKAEAEVERLQHFVDYVADCGRTAPAMQYKGYLQSICEAAIKLNQKEG